LIKNALQRAEARELFGEVLLYSGLRVENYERIDAASSVLDELNAPWVIEEDPGLWLNAKLHRGLALQALASRKNDGALLREALKEVECAWREGKKRHWNNAEPAERIWNDMVRARDAGVAWRVEIVSGDHGKSSDGAGRENAGEPGGRGV